MSNTIAHNDPERLGLILSWFPNPERDPDAYQRVTHVQNAIRLAMTSPAIAITPHFLGQNDAASGSITRSFESIAARAVVAVADISDRRMPVAYEVGYLSSLRKPLILIALSSQRTDIEKTTYFKEHKIIFYEDLRPFEKELVEHLENVVPSDQVIPVDLVNGVEQIRRKFLDMRLEGDLFSRCKQFEAELLVDRISKWSDRELDVWGSQQVRQVGASFHEHLKEGGYATLFYRGAESWEPDRIVATRDNYDGSLYDAIRVNPALKVKRVYILDNAEQFEEEAFRERALQDLEGNVDARYVVLEPEEFAEHQGIKDFAIWDENHIPLYARVDYDHGDPEAPNITKCTYARHRHEGKESSIITNANKNREFLESLELGGNPRVKPVPFLHTEKYYLRQSYKDNHTVAQKKCVDCKSLHGPWQTLKLLQMVANPAWHRKNFYEPAIRDFLDTREEGAALRVLLCGAADYGLLYHTADMLGREWTEKTKFVALDQCKTPLDSCEWFRQHHESPVAISVTLVEHTMAATTPKSVDTIDPNLREPFDLIIADGFLSDACPTSESKAGADEFRETVLRTWWEWLGSGGQIITTARLESVGDLKLSAARDDYKFRSTEQYATLKESSNLDQHWAERNVEEYVEHSHSVPIPNEDAIESLVKQISNDNYSYNRRVRKGEHDYELYHETTWADITMKKPK